MYKRYYVNDTAQDTGEHEVHNEDCPRLPSYSNRTDLGTFSNCHDAVRAARRHYSNVDGCRICSPECHTR